MRGPWLSCEEVVSRGARQHGRGEEHLLAVQPAGTRTPYPEPPHLVALRGQVGVLGVSVGAHCLTPALDATHTPKCNPSQTALSVFLGNP